MPVYIPKRTNRAPSLDSFIEGDEDDSDYLQDPEMNIDLLPQPFRMIDRLMRDIIDDSLEIALAREASRLLDNDRYKPPQHNCGKELHINNTRSIVSSPCGSTVFVGQSDSLTAVSTGVRDPAAGERITSGCGDKMDVAAASSAVDRWSDASMEVANARVALLATDDSAPSGPKSTFLVATVSTTGIVKIFIYHRELFYFIYQFAELTEKDASYKSIQLSESADFLGLSIHDAKGYLCTVFYNLAKETWFSEIQTLYNNLKQKYAAMTRAEELKLDVSTTALPTEDDIQQKFNSIPTQADRSPIKFIVPTLVTRVRCPAELTAVNAPTITEANDDSMPWDGSCHAITADHFTQRHKYFDKTYVNYLKYLKDKKETITATYHYLCDGRTSPVCENPSDIIPGMTKSVMIWWSGREIIEFHSLLKPVKDAKPLHVWSFSSPLASSVISGDKHFIAFALKNNNIIIWNYHFGMMRRVVNVDCVDPIISLHFLPVVKKKSPENPSNTLHCKPPNGKMVNDPYKELMVVYASGKYFTIPYSIKQVNEEPSQIFHRTSAQYSNPTCIKLLPNIPNLMLSTHVDGRIYISGLLEQRMLCEICLPANHFLATPLNPVFDVGNNGSKLYIKIIKKVEEEDTEVFQDKIFTISLDQINYLLEYLDNPVIDTHVTEVQCTMKVRTERIMKNRVIENTQRLRRMKKMWPLLKDSVPC